MTKFFATVCLPAISPEQVPDAIARALAPYDINAGERWNPAGEWDRWTIQVHRASPYLVRPAHDGDPRLLTPATVPGADLDPLGPLECYGGPRGLLDFDTMRQRTVQGYDDLRAAWDELAAAHPPARPLAEFVARHEADPDGYPLDRATEEHLLQPLVQEVAQRAVAGDPHFGTSFLTTDPVAWFARDHALARERALRTALGKYALVTLDGRWRDTSSEGYLKWADEQLEHLAPDTVVVDVLCHC
ncbi:hypothetical protein GCM10018980_75670 [Streptomyces capoamus]|uniref:Uncharacterized protein n=1 Tax=Streptomyces capoamus TaxID=68183 RepID=A0A919F4B7_9ACTN|nr:hypothetical protein [Streptomyces capoamus]GGW14524.1 hypothetical protein GCM10010501_22560 [Streptomyces libani subsp. rufus]GHG77367.1 hypothetical protein GCM10018980_75670 [Streptomyces capoamus]